MIFVNSHHQAFLLRAGILQGLKGMGHQKNLPDTILFVWDARNQKQTLLLGCHRLVEKTMSLSEIILQNTVLIFFASFHFGMEQFFEKDATVLLVPGV